MHWALGVPLIFGNVAAAVVAPRRKGDLPRSAAAVVLGVLAVISPRLLPDDWHVVRTVLAFGLTAGFFRVIEILRHPEAPTDARLLSVVYPVVSASKLARVPSSLRSDAFVVGGAFVVFALLLFFMAGSFPPAALYSGVSSLMRTILGGASLYFFVDGTARLSEATLALAGYDLGPLHDTPIAARTVSELWSRRWNRAVHAWLDENAFRPAMRLVTRRRPGRRGAALGMAAGVMAAFVASALLHAIPIWAAYDGLWAVVMAAFFVVHGALVLLEPRLGVARFRAPWPRIWTLGVFFFTAPLFVEPLLRALGR